jgi:hypothetical protein
MLSFFANKNADENSDPRCFKSAYLLFFDFEALQEEPESACSCSPDKIKARRWWEKELTEEERRGLAIEQEMLQSEIDDQWRDGKEYAGKGAAAPKSVPRSSRLPPMCTHRVLVEKRQTPFSYSLVVVDREGKVHAEKTYVGADAADNFVSTVMNLADRFIPTLSPGEPMELLCNYERDIAMAAEKCYLCNLEFHPMAKKCLDHDHLTGRLLGTAHSWCNLARRERHTLTCFAHNFSGYDSHFVVRALNRNERVKQLQAIPLNTQKFKSIQVNKSITFVDSCQFLLDSLSNLTDTLKVSGCKFDILEQMKVTGRQKELLLRKGVYPYSFATSIERLETTRRLPPRERFYNDLGKSECSEADYRHAEEVWKEFGVENMMEYTSLYVKTDVYLLAEVVTNFRNLVWENFSLDMCKYLSLPHLAKDIMLKYTGAEIELIHDQEMSDLFQKSIRGGLSFVNVRHAEKLPPAPDLASDGRGKPKSMLYVDANNLYGYAMSCPLPLNGFRWMEPSELEQFNVERDATMDDGPGYILEVDIEYPENLHILHNSYPLAPHSSDVTWNDLSDYSKSCLEALDRPTTTYKSKKLTSTFKKRCCNNSWDESNNTFF